MSECESDAYRAPPPAPYPDYNNINNNLNILDMDDDSIKIEARLEVTIELHVLLYTVNIVCDCLTVLDCLCNAYLVCQLGHKVIINTYF